MRARLGKVIRVHPTMTNAEITFIMDAIELTASHLPRMDERLYI